ncbi:hypothetical protein [Clostridium cellulovorans]|uniref:Uncharacterized protein n=1 Tax=Clostridium cellulovorans (strain ATCC 35296 / DSM 3052 / OCM 3 / 743B) TaxID=573061 RepID=D9SP41_CLOC7|nr:hypothetical protein [Clostridium cellulovorans]ADL52006.1 hypothetical protein Clocel_2268 [Clostridium cellulovorans 743B]
MNRSDLIEFVRPYYKNKDIMHNLQHIELIIKTIDKVIKAGKYVVEYENLIYGAYFHGVISTNENEMRSWLSDKKVPLERIERIITIASESFRQEIPTTLEGKILHDSHQIEGGKVYFITKCLITGTLRGQTLLETINYVEKNVLYNGDCYLPETKPIWKEANKFAETYIKELKDGII